MTKVSVLIASWLERRHADRIAAVDPDRVEVLYAPHLLPTTRYEADHHGPKRQLSEQQLAEWARLLERAEVSFDFDWQKPAEMLARAPRLKWVQSSSSGVGPMLRKIGVAGSKLVVTNAAGIHAQPLAEFALLSALYFAKDMPKLAKWKDERHWQRICETEVGSSRMLLIGLGKVGARIAELFSALGVEVVAHRRSQGSPPPAGVSRMVDADGIDAELPTIDYLVIAAPDTPRTLRMIDRRRLELLPSRAVIINVGRGSIIEEPAMIEMLSTGRLRGAGLDVFETEPLPTESPLWGLPNVIISPHSASTVTQENDRLVDLFSENLRRYLHGAPLVNVFDHARAD